MRSRVAPLALGTMLALSGCGDEATDGSSAQAAGPPKEGPQGLSAAEWGERLFSSYGCVACHSVGGFEGVAGPLDGIWGEPRTFADGSQGQVDEAYVRQSILRPDARVVEGAEPTMPAYEDVLSKPELDALVAFLREL